MIKFSIAKGIYANKEEVPTRICDREKWYDYLMDLSEPICAEIEKITDAQERASKKAKLPIKIPNGWIETGLKRLNENVHPNQTVYCDYDHIDNPREVWERIEQKVMLYNPIEVEVSASGHGLHLWLPCPDGFSIQEAQEFYAKEFGLEQSCDKGVHDLARAIYMVGRTNHLYLDREVLFGDKELIIPKVKKVEAKEEQKQDTTAKPVTEISSEDFPKDYQGIPFADIRDELLRLSPDIELDENGLPKVGFRHNAEVMLAQNFKTATDSIVAWLMQIIPNYEEDEAAWRQACESAKSYEVKYQSSNLLRQAIKNLKEKQNAVNESASGSTDWRYADNPPRMPKWLPKFIHLLTEKVPKVTIESVINASFSALASLTSGKVWFRSVPSNEHYELNMLTGTIAETSCGKSASNKVNELIMSSIEKEDMLNLEKEEEWKQNAAKKSANKEGEKRPILLIRICMSQMSEAALIRRASAAEQEGRKFLYCYYDELKDMMGLSSSKRAIKAISCHAFESKKYGKDCDGKDYLSARAQMRFNHHFNAVPADAKAWFEKDIHDGYFNRYSLAYIVKDRSQEFRYGDFDEDYAQRLEQYLQRIREFEGEIICPEAAEVARRLNNEVDEYVSQTYDEEFEELSRRALIIAHRKALIVFIASGCKWSKEIADFMCWSFKYDMWVKLHFFGKALREAREKDKVEKVQTCGNQLDWVKNDFTAEDMVQARKDHQAKNADVQKVRDALRAWKKRKYIKKNDDGTYTKLKFRSQE